MRIISEILTIEEGFFTTFAKEHEALYVDLFEDIEPQLLDIDLMASCSECFAAPLLLHYDLSKVVSLITVKFGDSWKRIKAALIADYNVLQPYDSKRITTQERTGTTANSSTTTDKTSVATFDSTTPIENQQDATENTGSIDQHETIKITVENTGNNGNLTAQNLLLNEIEVRKNNFISLVIGDVKNQITLDIY